MKKLLILSACVLYCLTACGNVTEKSKSEENIMTTAEYEKETDITTLHQEVSITASNQIYKSTQTTEATTELSETDESEEFTEMKIKLTVNGQELTATLYDNATARAFAEQLPTTLPMLDLYGREMCYRFSDELPTDNVQYTGYEVGEIVYWPPRHSFVIMYAQNGEQFEMQKVGRIDSGVEIFSETGDVDVTFESD